VSALNGECSVCGRTFHLDSDGNVNRHGTIGSVCEGSGKPPAKVTS
jgi:hypothetical protein